MQISPALPRAAAIPKKGSWAGKKFTKGKKKGQPEPAAASQDARTAKKQKQKSGGKGLGARKTVKFVYSLHNLLAPS
jgi:hypothetical protein